MPDLEPVPVQADVDLERIKYLMGDTAPSDQAAVSLVVKTFGNYEGKRLTNEKRWDQAARLYHGVVDTRKWDGSDVERASIPVPISFDQIEAAVPIVNGALFNYYPAFFDVLPGPGTSAAEAAQVRDVLAAYLETPFDETGLSSVLHMKMAVKQAAKFGDGVIELSWDPNKKRPVAEWVDLRDIYVDPTTPGACVDWSPSLVHRKLITVEELAALRDSNTKGINIPSDEVLNSLAKQRTLTMGDVTKQREASARREHLFISDLRTNPAHQLVEVLVYWSKDRFIWTLGRLWCAINQKNPLGFIPYCKTPWIALEGRPYSMSLPDILEGEQKYAQGIRNARLDNLALALHPPRVRAMGTPTTPSGTAWRPGLEDRVTDPKQVEIAQVQNVTQDAYREEELIYQNADRRSGVNRSVQSGVPIPSNSNRTATGVTSQTTAVSNRLSTMVENVEDYLIVPMLYKMLKMIRKYAPEQLQVVNAQQQTVTAKKSVFDKSITFRMQAGSRMRTKESLGQFFLPITQVLFNPAVIGAAGQQGKAIDFVEFARFFQDATGTSQSYQFFRDMNPQEQQMAQRPDPRTAAMLQAKQMDVQTRTGIASQKSNVQHEKNVLDYKARTGETAERSARELIATLAQDRSDQWDQLSGPDD